jgi:hypothetical protein
MPLILLAILLAAPAAVSPNLAVNGDFSEWQDQAPAGWTILEGHEAHARPVPEAVPEPVPEAVPKLVPGGAGRMLAFTTGYYFITASQQVHFPEVPAGKVVRLRARVQCFEANSCSVALSHPDHGDMHSPPHPGDGQWHELEVSFRVPAWNPRAPVVMTLGHGGIPEQPAYFDDVRLTVED